MVLNCYLLEPFLGQVISSFMGIDEWPGVMTWGGVFLVFVACNILHYSHQQESKPETLNTKDVKDEENTLK